MNGPDTFPGGVPGEIYGSGSEGSLAGWFPGWSAMGVLSKR